MRLRMQPIFSSKVENPESLIGKTNQSHKFVVGNSYADSCYTWVNMFLRMKCALRRESDVDASPKLRRAFCFNSFYFSCTDYVVKDESDTAPLAFQSD